MNNLEKLQEGFLKLGSSAVDSKDAVAYHKSRSGHRDAMALFGGQHLLPTSVMKPEKAKTDESVDRHGHLRGYIAMGKKDKSFTRLKSKEMQKMKMASATGSRKGALSTFFQGIGRTWVLFYTKPGDLVCDPFAGHNSRMDLCIRAGRDYEGQDLSVPFMEHNRKRAKELKRLFPERTIRLHEGDSRKLQMKSESGDFTITSPPYWNVEDYGNEPGQLGKLKGGYKAFLRGIGDVLEENFRVLKPGAYAMWFINDIRHKGFYPYHIDIADLGRAAGFTLHDIMIVDYGRSHRDCFINQAMEQKIIPKRHEYGIVFQKPLPPKKKRIKR